MYLWKICFKVFYTLVLYYNENDKKEKMFKRLYIKVMKKENS